MTAATAPSGRPRLVRWKAVVPLAVFAALAALAWWLFADRLARRAAEAVGTAVLGARVDIARLHLDLAGGKVSVGGLIVASPWDSLKNLLEADELVADVDALPLLEKKVVVDRLAATGLRFGTPRATSGIVPSTGPTATQRVAEGVKQWAANIDFPALQLATGKIDVGRLDPAQLATPREAKALAARADSSRAAWNTALQGLNVGATADSGVAMVNRLKGAKPTDLALLNQARRTLEQIKQARDRVTALERNVTTGVAGLQAGVAGLGEARQRDYTFARGLLKLPALDAPDVGAALFGPAAVARFQRALYLAQLGRRYIPPGLLPHAEDGPKRMRRAGTTVRFPREHALPAFLLREGELSFQLAGSGASSRVRNYAGKLTGLTSDPAVYGRPMVFTAAAPALNIGALIDHVRPTPRDTAGAVVGDVQLPTLALGALPLRLDAGRGTVSLAFALTGDTLRGRWGVHSDALRWVRDSATGGETASPVQHLVEHALTGISSLEITAELRGTIAHPTIAVSSNLDKAIADRIRAVVGEQAAAAEAKLRAQVDSIVEREVAPVRAQVAAASGDVTTRLSEQRGRLEQAQKNIEQRLRELTGGLRLP